VSGCPAAPRTYRDRDHVAQRLGPALGLRYQPSCPARPGRRGRNRRINAEHGRQSPAYLAQIRHTGNGEGSVRRRRGNRAEALGIDAWLGLPHCAHPADPSQFHADPAFATLSGRPVAQRAGATLVDPAFALQSSGKRTAVSVFAATTIGRSMSLSPVQFGATSRSVST